MNFSDRLDKLHLLLRDSKLSAALITNNTNIIYLTGYNNFSKEEREAFLLITLTDQYLLTDARYTEEVRIKVPHFKVIEISAKNRLKKALRQLARQHHLNTVGIEEDDLTLAESKIFSPIFTRLKPVSLSKIRSIKDPTEIDLIKQACQLADRLFDFILTKIKPGLTEKELAWEMEKFAKNSGASFSFDPIVAFNANASMPHYQTGDIKLPKQSGQLILLDFGVKVADYCSDMTRVIFLGQPTADQKKIYQTVKDSHDRAVDYLQKHIKQAAKHGISAAATDQAARAHIIAAGYPDIPHSLGHGIGLEVHEFPRLSPLSQTQLQPGMVFSIEPGIYLPNQAGVRIEDLYTINNGQLIQLTISPSNLIKL